MGLTRPTAAQIDSSTEVITDPISLLNNKSNRANVDVGFLFNRDGGISSNVALFWQESNQQFVFALTSSNAVSRFSNIVVTSNANVVTGNVRVYGNLTVDTFVKTSSTTVTGLTAAATAGAGARSFVTDANTAVFGSAVSGSGAISVPVYSDGSAWRVG